MYPNPCTLKKNLFTLSCNLCFLLLALCWHESTWTVDFKYLQNLNSERKEEVTKALEKYFGWQEANIQKVDPGS